MTDAELLVECKKGLSIQVDSTAFDSVLMQKLLAVKSYMKGSGIADEIMTDNLAVGVIVMGVGDLWNLGGGEIKFSPVFHILLTQLAAASSLLMLTSIPVDKATGIAIDVKPILTFNRRLASYSVRLAKYDTQIDVSFASTLDITGKVVTITPNSFLDAATKYAIVIDAVSEAGPSLAGAVIDFTTI